MGEIQLPVLLNLLIFLVFPFIGGYAAIKLRLPTIIGYITGGILLGTVLGDQVSSQVLSQFASFGIILLLFTVGLDVNLKDLTKFGRFVLIGGIAQIVISAVVIFLLSLVFGFKPLESIFIGSAFAFSSTAVVARIIQEKNEESSLLGGIIIGILILQDLAVIPLIIILSALGNTFEIAVVFKSLFFGVVKSSLLLTLIYVLGKNIVPFVFDRLAQLSRELLNLFTIFFILLIVAIFSLLGLSPSIAAFIAGILIGQTLEHYHIFSQIRPLRDIFAILFFVFLGASVNLALVVSFLPKIIFFTLLLILLKFFVILFIFILYRFHSRTSFSIAIYLAQIGEFAFVIMYQGLSQAVLGYSTYLFAISSVLLTFIVTPFLISNINQLYLLLKKAVKKYLPALAIYITNHVDREAAAIEVFKIKDHIVICGFGRVGKYIGLALKMSQIPFIVIDYDYYTVRIAKKQHINAIYGDPTDIDILEYAETENAVALVSTVPDTKSQESIISSAKKLNPDIKILTRLHRARDQKKLRDMGAEVIVQPEFEASLSIAKQILQMMGLSQKKIYKEFKKLKKAHDLS